MTPLTPTFGATFPRSSSLSRRHRGRDAAPAAMGDEPGLRWRRGDRSPRVDEARLPAKRVLLCSSSQSQICFALMTEREQRRWDGAAGGIDGASSLVS